MTITRRLKAKTVQEEQDISLGNKRETCNINIGILVLHYKISTIQEII
jgi:hypothetical protein